MNRSHGGGNIVIAPAAVSTSHSWPLASTDSCSEAGQHRLIHLFFGG